MEPAVAKSTKMILRGVAIVYSLLAAGILGAAIAVTVGKETAPKLEASRGFDPSSVIFAWNGPIRPGMAQEIADAFDQWKGSVNRVLFALNSAGGSVREGEAVIAVFKEIKKTHKFDTVVVHGNRCSSFCVALFLQGQKRLGARTSIWLFHEVGTFDGKGDLIDLNPERTEAIFEKYYKPAGVSEKWLVSVKASIMGKELWQTGEDLIRNGSNIITDPIDNLQKRTLKARITPAPEQLKVGKMPSARPV